MSESQSNIPLYGGLFTMGVGYKVLSQNTNTIRRIAPPFDGGCAGFNGTIDAGAEVQPGDSGDEAAFCGVNRTSV